MIRSDSHFMIGHSHTVCEDYSANLGGFAALADGCSAVMDDNGVRMEAHTDIGARLLVRSAFHHAHAASELFGTLAIHTADSYRRQLDLPLHTLSATLGCVRLVDHCLECRLFGDGVVAARDRSSKAWAWSVASFGGHPPRYLRYELRDNDLATYEADHGSMFGIESNWLQSGPREYPYRIFCNRHTYDMAIIMSDGATSFTCDSRPVPFVKLADRLFDFRRMKGRFVLRQLAGITKDLAKEGIVHQDDISMIALYDDGEPCPSTT